MTQSKYLAASLYLCVCISFVLTTETVHAQSCSSDLIIAWSDTFDFGSRNDIAYDVTPFDDDNDGHKDDGFVMVGTHQEVGGNKTQGLIIKVSESGVVQWRDTAGKLDKNDHFNSVIQGSNGKIIVCGWTKTTGEAVNAWVLEYDTSGGEPVRYEYGGSGFDEAWDIIEDEENEVYVIVGRAGYADPPDGDLDDHASINADSEYWVFSVDRETFLIGDLNEIYHGNYTGGSGEDWATSIIIDDDGNYLVSGFCASCDPGKVQWEAMHLLLETDGDTIWRRAYGYNPVIGSRDQGTFDVIQLTEFGTDYFMAAGTHHPSEHAGCFDGFDHDVYVLKSDDDGDDIWTPGCELHEGKNYGGRYADNGYSIVETCDKEYLIAGNTKSPIDSFDITCNNDGTYKYTSDAWLLKLNRNGTIDWDASFGEEDNDEFHSIEKLEDGSYIAIGEFGADDYGQLQNFYVVRFEIEECTTRLAYPASASSQGITVNPNPSKGLFEVSIAPLSDIIEPVLLEILDQAGQIVFERMANLTEEYPEGKIDATFLPAGFYLLRILSENESRFAKVIIQ